MHSEKLVGDKSLVSEIIYPKIIQQENLTLLAFDVMKLIPAVYILRQAVASGQLKPGGTILEISSGTFALALAMIASASGFRLRIITIDIDQALLWRLKSLGAEVHVVTEPDSNGSIQGAQLALLDRFREEEPEAFWCQQYENADNPAAYQMLAEFLERNGVVPDVLVGTVGTGGSMTGTARALRQHVTNMRVVAVDSLYSVSFGAGQRPVDPACSFYMDQMLGLGSRVQMSVLDHTQFDEVHWLPFRQMVKSTHALHDASGLMMGPTSGAAYHVAAWIAANNPDRHVAVILPDTGVRYINNVYDRHWLTALGMHAFRGEAAPKRIAAPHEADFSWVVYPWERQSYESMAKSTMRPAA